MAMEPFAPTTVALATTTATLLAWRALRRRSLTRAGAAVGFAVGFLLVATGLRGLVLFYFYQIGSMATRYRAQSKAKLDATVQTTSERGGTQVLCVSIVAVALSLTHACCYGAEQPIDFLRAPGASRLATAVLAHHAVSLGDTLASELGMLSSSASGPPILITQPWKRVPVGTNGGITVAGTLWSIAGGWIMGALTVAMDAISGIQPLRFQAVVVYGGVCGFVGSLIDSLLGASLQATYYDRDAKKVQHQNDTRSKSIQHLCGRAVLTNEQVNLVSVALTALLGGWVIAPWLFGNV